MPFQQLFEIDIYYCVATFLLYSMLGWLVESFYMSLCNKKLTNRGFGKGPFCPIYGFGAMIGYALLAPLQGNVFAVYFAGAISATIFEFCTGKMMIKTLGELWWDYSDKPFNYKGILCLESTIAWGFYALGIVYFLNDKVVNFIYSINPTIGSRVVVCLVIIISIDYGIQLTKAFNVDTKKYTDKIKDKVISMKDRF